MRKDARVTVCDKHDEVYHTIKNVGYEYDSNLWGECPLCWVLNHEVRHKALIEAGVSDVGTVDDRLVAERFSLNAKPTDLVEVWSAIPSFAVGLSIALASVGVAQPKEYDGPKYLFDAVVETYFLTPSPRADKVLEFDPNWEYGVIRGLTGGRYQIDRVPWPTGRMEFAGPHPEDEEFTIHSFALDAVLDEHGLPNPALIDAAHATSNTVRIYKKEEKVI